MSSNQIDKDYAKAWDLHQGNFAHGIAEKIVEFSRDHKRKIKTALDVCCGAGNLLSVFSNYGITGYGTETRQGMIDYVTEKYPDKKFFLTKNMYDMPIKKNVDLVTCTHDIINYLETLDEWKQMFKNAYKSLNGNGMFLFDYYSKHKLQGWEETTYSSSDYLDCVQTVKSGIYDKSVITLTYFINYNDYMRKTRDIIVESYFENQVIFDELKKAGFKKIKVVDENLNEIDNVDFVDRVIIIAMKK